MNIRHAFPLALSAALLTGTAVHLSAANARPSAPGPASRSERQTLKLAQAGKTAEPQQATKTGKRDLSKPSLSPEQQELLEKALRAKMDELGAPGEVNPTQSSLAPTEEAALETALHQKMAAIAATGAPSTSVGTGSPLAPNSNILAGMEAPALPLTTQQKLQLDELLTLYLQDTISPGEYHSRRADIVATN